MKKLQKFEEWLKETHPESLEEGWMKNLAVGGALLGAGVGLGKMHNNSDNWLKKDTSANSVSAADDIANFKRIGMKNISDEEKANLKWKANSETGAVTDAKGVNQADYTRAAVNNPNKDEYYPRNR